MKYKILVYNYGKFVRYFMATFIEVMEVMCEADRIQKYSGVSPFCSIRCGHYEYILLGEVNFKCMK